MRKIRILIRLTMIIFMFSLPVYQLNALRVQYLEERRIDIERSERLLGELKDGFLIRRENFYEDSQYKREFAKLQQSK